MGRRLDDILIPLEIGQRFGLLVELAECSFRIVRGDMPKHSHSDPLANLMECGIGADTIPVVADVPVTESRVHPLSEASLLNRGKRLLSPSESNGHQMVSVLAGL